MKIVEPTPVLFKESKRPINVKMIATPLAHDNYNSGIVAAYMVVSNVIYVCTTKHTRDKHNISKTTPELWKRSVYKKVAESSSFDLPSKTKKILSATC